MNSNNRRHIVIVRGGFGGITAAKTLKKADVDITIIDRSNHHLFQPLLCFNHYSIRLLRQRFLRGILRRPIRTIVGERQGIRVIWGEVRKVFPEENKLLINDNRIVSYDKLILASGSEYNYFGNDEWAKEAPGLKSISDALNIRERILMSLEEAEQIDDPKLREPFLTFVVIGGGPTGVEMSVAIAEMAKRNMMRHYSTFSKNGTRVFLVEAGPKILTLYPEKLSENARKMLEDMGVRVLRNTAATGIKKHSVRFSEGVINTPNIIWAAGVKASPLLNCLHVDQDRMGRVKINEDLSVPKYPTIYAIGDAAYLEDSNGDPLPALAPVAMQQGEFLGNLLSEKPNSKDHSFHYIDKCTMATIGRAKAVANLKGFKVSGFLAWLMWSFVYILQLITFRKKYEFLSSGFGITSHLAGR
jgi:NADH dehydrogenase